MAFTINGTSGINLATQPLTGALPDANAPSGGVIQVVQAIYSTQTSTTSSSYVATGLTASITPSSSSSKILVFVTLGSVQKSGDSEVYFRLYKNGSNLVQFGSDGSTNSTAKNNFGSVCTDYLDSPATTSSITYAIYWSCYAGQTCIFSNANMPSTITLMEIAA